MSRRRKWQPDPCSECGKENPCNRSLEDGSMCEERFQYLHFKKVLKHGHRIQFFEYREPSLAERYHVSFVLVPKNIHVVPGGEEDFSEGYKRMLFEKFRFPAR
jgi:hypothetical protein